jgi:hypothetical protein
MLDQLAKLLLLLANVLQDLVVGAVSVGTATTASAASTP